MGPGNMFELADCHVNADTKDKTNQNALGQEVGDPAHPQNRKSYVK